MYRFTNRIPLNISFTNFNQLPVDNAPAPTPKPDDFKSPPNRSCSSSDLDTIRTLFQTISNLADLGSNTVEQMNRRR